MNNSHFLPGYLFVLIFIYVNSANSQPLDYQLRLEPVWSRVADALGELGSVESAEFSPDGKYVVSGTKYDNSIIMWRTSDGSELWRKYSDEEIERVGWSYDNTYVAAASEDFMVRIYNAKDGELVKKIEYTSGIDGLTWTHNSNLLAIGEERTESEGGKKEGWIHIFDMSTQQEIYKMDFGNTVNELFFSQDDQYLLAVGHGGVKIYQVSDWSLVQTLNPSYYVAYISGTFSPDSKYVIATGHAEHSRGSVFLWEWKSGKLIKTFNHTGKKIESLSWHPNGQYIAHAGHDPYIYVYRLSDLLRFSNDDIPITHKTWAGDHSEYIDFNADGSFLVSAHQNGLIKLWVWMGEDPSLNSKRHREITESQRDAYKE